MLNWLLRFLRRIERWVTHTQPEPKTYQRSNLHGRYR